MYSVLSRSGGFFPFSIIFNGLSNCFVFRRQGSRSFVFFGIAVFVASLIASGNLYGQAAQLHFKITDDGLSPLPGVYVVVKGEGKTYEAVSDSNGEARFLLESKGAYHYEASLLGYAAVRSLREIVVDEPKKTVLMAMQPVDFFLDAAIVKSTRSSASAPIAQTTLSRDDIGASNEGQDLPYILQQLPSVVSSSDAGAGIGYTAMRIRGVDTRSINVTINGIPYNDSESQGVFWVNMPDLASSLESVQVQRGIGASTHGTGAFGATVNLETNRIRQEAFANTSHTFGSFNTRKHNVQAGTGLMGNNFYLESRLSYIT